MRALVMSMFLYVHESKTLTVELYGKQLFTWLSLVVSLMASFVLSFFPTRCLG